VVVVVRLLLVSSSCCCCCHFAHGNNNNNNIIIIIIIHLPHWQVHVTGVCNFNGQSPEAPMIRAALHHALDYVRGIHLPPTDPPHQHILELMPVR
jgi:hypothetical protein